MGEKFSVTAGVNFIPKKKEYAVNMEKYDVEYHIFGQVTKFDIYLT